jgi:hypothetical protein
MSFKKGVGNWCGPGWTAGQSKDAIDMTKDDFNVPALFPLDEVCKQHDIDLNQADTPNEVQMANELFVIQARRHGIMGNFFAGLVDTFGPGEPSRKKRKHNQIDAHFALRRKAHSMKGGGARLYDDEHRRPIENEPREAPPATTDDPMTGQVATRSSTAAATSLMVPNQETAVMKVNPTYQLQDTHTTILPCYFNFSFAGVNHSTPTRLTINCTNIVKPFESYPALSTVPTTGTITNGVFAGQMPNGTTWAATRLDALLVTSASGILPGPQGYAFWKKIYEYYTVTGVQYTLRVYPNTFTDVKNHGYMVGQHREAFKRTDRANQAVPDTGMSLWRMKHVEGINWTEEFGISGDDGHTNLVREFSGVYYAGNTKTNVQNDEDQKTWHKTATDEEPDLEETHNFLFYRQPTTARIYNNEVFRYNCTLELKYMVQFKDRYHAWRYYNVSPAVELKSSDMVA